ncbi:uncharacterized protein MYCFIDRAFT_175897 [Pseudocercospora fijiensis CIRAD86]|uniref:Uncharacterized protein n=1 Tax=Pseudocercospora fijiensis (strain CIRAD86) TaxID=383855 RepID=M2ZTM6_PSEFD|nr:uncharacterized protein MYCFIDRAFT_175897 [Pseudocercospora fijiensis CIRAD86]EME82359.1 hypothetical protein MYCFIDRAFT_175897 [Pseudocercospora fijiensis CIRAD86]
MSYVVLREMLHIEGVLVARQQPTASIQWMNTLHTISQPTDKPTSIAAEHFGSYALIHAHIHLLAGLYKAHQGKVSECGYWYSSVARRHDQLSLHNNSTTPKLQGSFTLEHDLILTASRICLFLKASPKRDKYSVFKNRRHLRHRDGGSGRWSNDEGAFLAAQIELWRMFQRILRLKDGDGSLNQNPAPIIEFE